MKTLRHSRARRLRVALCALVAGCGATLPAMVHAQVSSIGGATDGSDSMRLPRNRFVAGTAACVVPSDCNDHAACTADICVEGTCMNLPIPGCVPCELSYECPPVDLVFIMDTSGSMRDEAAILCAQAYAIRDELADLGINVYMNTFGITDLPGGPFDCLFETVLGYFGPTVPGELQSCPFPDGSAAYETWGPAVAIMAQYNFWTPGATRLIIPMSDEGPCNGSRPEGCNDPGDDRESIDNAIAVALANNVIVSPIAGTGSDACVINLGTALAKATGGVFQQLKDPKSEFKESLLEVVLRTCVADASCDDREPCTENDSCNEGRCLGTPVEDCRVCEDEIDCEDQDVCTSDSCVDGFCVWTPLHDPTICCNPETGGLTPLTDGNDCTVDVCDPETGEVTHTPGPGGNSCTDDEACTINDVCDPNGKCNGTPIYTIPCQSDADCFGNTCSPAKNMCVCNEVADLCLDDLGGVLRGEGCYNVGEDVYVNVVVGNNPLLVAGGQFLIEYDPEALQFVDIATGDFVDPESPFGTELSRTVDETNGKIFYAVGVVLGGPLTHGPSVMASIHFKALDACASTEVCFGDQNPMNTRLTDSSGHNLPFEPCCTGEIRINGAKPSLTCPHNITLNAEAGTLSAAVSWPSVSTAPSCPQGDVELSCTSSSTSGIDVDFMLEHGGRAPLGKSSFGCVATDGCGAENSCHWDVTVRNLNTVEVDLQLSSTVAAGPLRRCIEFAFYSSCTMEPVIIQKTVEFGLPYNLAGRADDVQLTIPPGQYYCATARDTMHSLRSRAALSVEGTKYVVKFVGDPAMGGNWLIGGNVDGNTVIDAVDQALVMSQYLQTMNPQSPCGTTGFHTDINGDGVVGVDDLSFIQRNLLKTDAAPCCQGNTASAPDEGREEFSLEELSELGYGNLETADINGDGLINRTDLELFLRNIGAGEKKGSRPAPTRSR